MLTYFGDYAYSWMIKLNTLLNWIRTKFNMKYWSLSGFIKGHVKDALAYINNFENAVVEYVKFNKYDGVICGHLHQPCMKEIDGIKYNNCGDWIENNTALVETLEGEIKLIKWDFIRND